MAVKEVELVKKENTDQEIELILIREGDFIKSLREILKNGGQAEHFKKGVNIMTALGLPTNQTDNNLFLSISDVKNRSIIVN